MQQTSAAGSTGLTQNALGWGIVGTGVIAEHFAASLRLVEGAFVAAVSSRSAEKGAEFAVRHGGTVHGDLASLLGDEAVGAIYIASPNDTHFRIARTAIQAGKGVLVEKPLTTTMAEAKALAALASERKVFLMEGLWTRFLPAVDFVRKAIDSGAIGEVRRIEGNLEFMHPYDAGSRFFDPARGGGVLLDLGVYLISLSLLLMGRPDAVSGAWRAAPSGADRQADIALGFGSVRAQLSCSFDRAGANQFLIEGTRGVLILQPPFIGARQVLEARGPAATILSTMATAPTASRIAGKVARTVPLPGILRHRFDFSGYGLQFEIDAATRAIRAGRTDASAAPLADTVETLRIIEEIKRRPPV